MQMLYNSDSYTVVEIELPLEGAVPHGVPHGAALRRGGFEIVDKFARKEIFIEGALAQSFKEGVEALIENKPTVEEFDDFLSRFSPLMQQALIMH